MAPPIAEVRHAYQRLSGATVGVVGATVQSLSPSALADAIQVRTAVAVAVGRDLRRAAWAGFTLSLVAAFAQPFVVERLNPDDGYQSFVLKIIQRGDWWTIASAVVACIGLVSMVFTSGAARADRLGLVGLATTSVAGIVAGAPAVIALAVSVLVAVVLIALGVAFTWILVATLCAMATD